MCLWNLVSAGRNDRIFLVVDKTKVSDIMVGNFGNGNESKLLK